jgi:UDP-GlcNAc3NAcA epimerase
MKIVTIIGARPQFIKAATVSRALRQHEDVREVLVHTGQHFDDNMSEVFFREMGIPDPAYHLGIHGGTHGKMTGQMLEKIEEVLLAEKPDWVLVYGDTNSTLAGALAAVKLHIPLAHVEAGLRSYNRRMPEEINRVLTDHASDLLFAPTLQAVDNLTKEGLDAQKIRRVGDVMCDAAKYFSAQAESGSKVLERLQLSSKSYVLATLHRAENTEDAGRLSDLLACLNSAAEEMPVVLPLHPRTQQAIERMGLAQKLSSGIKLIEPVGYLDMVMLEMHARVVATDSGGVQKEAYFHRTPCITLREETEWVELVDSGWNVLAGRDVVKFKAAFRAALDKRLPEWSADLYGDGHAAEDILRQLISAKQ